MNFKYLIIFSILIAIQGTVFASGNLPTSPAAQNTIPNNIAVIDIQKVVAASSQVKSLKKAQEAKNKELAKFIKDAQAEVNKQSDEKSKKAIAEKYEKQLIMKREANTKEYLSKLQEIDKNITSQIGKKANEMGYTLVISKSSVVYGGNDITEAVLKVIK